MTNSVDQGELLCLKTDTSEGLHFEEIIVKQLSTDIHVLWMAARSWVFPFWMHNLIYCENPLDTYTAFC